MIRSPSPPVRGTAALSLVALLVAVATGGCTRTTPSPSAQPVPTPSAVAPDRSIAPAPPRTPTPTTVWLPEWAGDGAVPLAVSDRRPLPFCGVERPPAPQPGIFVDRAVRLCFWNAHLGGTEAEFVSVQTTIEGDPIATTYRLESNGTVQVLTDMTQDRFGGGAWITSTCQQVVEGAGDELLGVAECDEGKPLR